MALRRGDVSPSGTPRLKVKRVKRLSRQPFYFVLIYGNNQGSMRSIERFVSREVAARQARASQAAMAQAVLDLRDVE